LCLGDDYQDLLAELEWLAYVKGVGPASPEAPREN
jgi:hypothetical protein